MMEASDQLYAPGSFTPGETGPTTLQIRDLGPRAGLNAVEDISCPYRESNRISSAF
jgi:hypothetical protein